MLRSLGIYIHIPFCEKKCRYCGFLSYGGTSIDNIDDYVNHLVKEIEINGKDIGKNYLVDSIFIGGGTPSLLTAAQVKAIMDSLYKYFMVSEDCEITIESNPNSLDELKLRTYLKCGINRLSMGVQSFDNEVLKTLGRVHTRDEVLRAYNLARECGFENINLDLMFGLPNQDMDTWLSTLNEAIELGPEHISFYTLQLEEGTDFYKSYKDGIIDLPPLHINNEMYHKAIKILGDNGYIHYEISNSAKDGYGCSHNLKYWTMQEYLGMGLGASSFLMGHRAKNLANLDEYYDMINENYPPIDSDEFHEETLEEAIGIYVFTALRMRDGLDLEDFKLNFGKSFEEVFPQHIDWIKRMADDGLVIYDGEVFALTEEGIDISNEIMCEFV